MWKCGSSQPLDLWYGVSNPWFRCFAIRNPIVLPVRILEGSSRRFVLTCEHASCAIPVEYDALGVADEHVRDHIGWDIGSGRLSELLAADLGVAAVLSGVSRLVIDCNRDFNDHDLIPSESHGVVVPGNRDLDRTERRRRVEQFHDPFHDAVDAVVEEKKPDLLLSIHSFTPTLNGRERRFDIGVLFDLHEAEARKVGGLIEERGFKVRYNQPYSGLDGLIYSVRRHGLKHAVRYLELEVNNGLLRDEIDIRRMADRIGAALKKIVL